jgi:uncharacterized protein (DUF924 family)
VANAPCSADRVLDFWFEEAGPERWWRKDREFDAVLAERFGGCHDQATRGELFSWRETVLGRLAEIIVLDQFSRNIYRQAVGLFSEKGMESNLEFELQHKRIIDRFGRYPHRNHILGRESSADELDFLSRPGSSF